MKIYLANIYPWMFPDGARRLLIQHGHELAGNWLQPPHRQSLHRFGPDVIVYSPHRREGVQHDLPMEMPVEVVKEVPTVLWAIYPDYLTGWDKEHNVHAHGLIEPFKKMLPHFRVRLVNSGFTKRLLEARAPGYTFEVCYLGIDAEGIAKAAAGKQRWGRPTSVMWQHRWATDKNLPGALEIILHLAPRYSQVTFYLGRKEDWEEFWSPQWLKDLYAAQAPELARLANVRLTPRPPTQQEYWSLIADMDIAFSCSYHESFGIGMLEHAYLGAACVVPDRVAYPEVHAGALVVAPSQVEAGIESLLNDPVLWHQVAASSRANAAQYTVERTVERLLGFIESVSSSSVRIHE